MAHKTNLDARRARNNKNVNGEIKNQQNDAIQDGREKDCDADAPVCPNGESRLISQEDREEEITERFVGVDETDRAIPNISKVHVLKTRSSSEQNLMLKTSSLRKGKFLSSSFLYNKEKQKDCDKLNNNSCSEEFLDKNLRKDFKSCEEITSLEYKKNQLNDGVNEKNEKDDVQKDNLKNTNNFKKNSNVYSVFQAKTVLSERRRSLPTLPKLIGQKIHDHNAKTISKSAECPESSPLTKDFKVRTMRTLSKGLGRLLKRHSSINISEPDPVFKVAYLGNVLTGWAKGEGCVDKPLSTLWRNYNQSSKPDVVMKLSITNSGLKGITKEHGLTEYWAHRITFCSSPTEFPKIFCWVYRHEGRKLKHELRCHAVLCSKDSVAKRIATELQAKIQQALLEFKRDKISRQNARLSLANSVYENPSMPRRKILLSVGANNYKPPLERSKSAPKLTAIEEMCSEEDEEELLANTAKNARTWTKDNSALKVCCKAEEIFPSYTLGRRKCERSSCDRKISLPESRSQIEELPFQSNQVLEDSKFKNVDDYECVHNTDDIVDESNRLEVHDDGIDDCGFGRNVEAEFQRSLSSRRSNNSNRVTFSFSNVSEYSDKNEVEDINGEDDVFYCETDDHHEESNEAEIKEESIEKTESNVDQICRKTNFLVLDSDEGSISSGCESASTVTSSDIEMTSLPCNFTQNDYDQEKPEKVSVLERVQSFEQLFMREKSSSIRSVQSSFKTNFTYGKCSRSFRIGGHQRGIETNSEITGSSPSDSACFSSTSETGPASCSDEVNLVPLGEKHDGIRRTYLRGFTFPPSTDDIGETDLESAVFLSQSSMDSENLSLPPLKEFTSNYKEQGDPVGGDSDSACSVESGYSELLDGAGGPNECIIGSTVMV